ncbi:hypothetical protein GCM10007874_50260 [Labrys miyagiensis]|uniref:Uncharacterized protein n=1 Tax=Labrys miyagiensis TaxID=346912 RepID=A0ABQ6CQI4_9HYPH|nr:hypothetical protein [Labrys miyagiensis]GLS22009.1 hypothetical protein GCM10007874_50260 [Labrys miyagiensis]
MSAKPAWEARRASAVFVTLPVDYAFVTAAMGTAAAPFTTASDKYGPPGYGNCNLDPHDRSFLNLTPVPHHSRRQRWRRAGGLQTKELVTPLGDGRGQLPRPGRDSTYVDATHVNSGRFTQRQSREATLSSHAVPLDKIVLPAANADKQERQVVLELKPVRAMGMAA